jgi:hypothetical protein
MFNNITYSDKDDIPICIKQLTENTKKILEIYKFLSDITPYYSDTKWNIDIENTECENYTDKQDLQIFGMFRTIHNIFQNISQYKKNINTPFQRAIWHISCIADFTEVSHENDTYIMFILTFSLLSRKKTFKEFEYCYTWKPEIVSSNASDNNLTITVPEWLCERFNSYDVFLPKCVRNYAKISDTVAGTINILVKLNPVYIYDLLSSLFKKEIVSIGSVVYNTLL